MSYLMVNSGLLMVQTGNNRVGDFDYLTKYFNPLQNAYVFNNTYVDGVIATNLGNSKLKVGNYCSNQFWN